MFSKINILGIIRDHVSTLKDYETKKYNIEDFFIFFFVPLLISSFTLWLCGIMNNTAVIAITTSLSIFAALLFNLLLLAYDAIRKEENLQNPSKEKIRFLKQVFTNISFCILISVFSIVVLLIFSQISSSCIAQYVLSFFSYYFISLFILTLLMILKRTHILLQK